MGQLVDDGNIRPALDQSIEVELFKAPAFVLNTLRRNDLKALEQRLSFPSPVGLYHSDDNIGVFSALRLRRQQHLERFADTRGRTEKNLETARLALAALHLL